MNRWTGVVVAALSSWMLAACGVADGTDAPDTSAQQEVGLYVCGDGFCNRGEPATCPQDCNYGGYCGDGYCSGPETSSTCYQDCHGGCIAAEDVPAGDKSPSFYVCGDGFCNQGEPATCPQDCTYGGYCGDGYCSGPETSSTCSQDCHSGCLTGAKQELRQCGPDLPPCGPNYTCISGVCRPNLID